MEEIIEKTDTYPEAIIGDEAFCKICCLYLTIDYFCKTLHITCFSGYEYALIKLNMTTMSANLFLNYILSSHYYLAVRP